MAFPNVVVRNLRHVYSDHCPFIVYTEGLPTPPPLARPFHFKDMWASHPEFTKVITDSWNNPELPFMENLHILTDNIKTWNRDTFGNIFKNKRRILARLEGIERTQCISFSQNLFLLEKVLIRDFQNILKQGEVLWYQKSRAKWILEGDRNTKFFHFSTIIRSRRNRILSLKDSGGNWINDVQEIKLLINNHFMSIFCISVNNTSMNWSNWVHDCICGLHL